MSPGWPLVDLRVKWPSSRPNDYHLQWRRLIYMPPFTYFCCFGCIPKLYPTLCDPMNCSTPGSLVLCYLLEIACYPTISSSASFSFCLQSFPASGSFPMSWFFTSGGQSIETSGSASVLPMNIHFCLYWGISPFIDLFLFILFEYVNPQD